MDYARAECKYEQNCAAIKSSIDIDRRSRRIGHGRSAKDVSPLNSKCCIIEIRSCTRQRWDGCRQIWRCIPQCIGSNLDSTIGRIKANFTRSKSWIRIVPVGKCVTSNLNRCSHCVVPISFIYEIGWYDVPPFRNLKFVCAQHPLAVDKGVHLTLYHRPHPYRTSLID